VLERRVAALGLGESETLALQDRLDQPTLGGIVINHKDRLGHLSSISERGAPFWPADLFRGDTGER
jgi:hypothetical protein